ncbi:hypothetical protein [Natronococcus wangiae]|nr:hypothetical protein [Natronococcus sp. AD5]
MDDADRDSEGYNDQADPELEKLSLSEGDFEGAIVATDGGRPLDE